MMWICTYTYICRCMYECVRGGKCWDGIGAVCRCVEYRCVVLEIPWVEMMVSKWEIWGGGGGLGLFR